MTNPRRSDDIDREIYDWYAIAGKTMKDISVDMKVSLHHVRDVIDRHSVLAKSLTGKFPPIPSPNATAEHRAWALRRRVAALEQEVITLRGRCDMLIGSMAVRTTLHKDDDDGS